MRLFALILAVFKKAKSDIPLFVTGSLLFYYLFKNELDMLNSYAENELLPHITNDIDFKDESNVIDVDVDIHDPVEDAAKNLMPIVDAPGQSNKEMDDTTEKKADSAAAVNLYDLDTLIEKNRFFPILQNSFDAKDTFTQLTIQPTELVTAIKKISRKLKHLLVDKYTWKTSYEVILDDYPAIQTIKFSDKGFAVEKELSKVKEIFQETFHLYSKIIAGEVDEVKPLSKKKVNNGNGFGRTLIGSIDMLYLLGMEQELETLIKTLTEEDTLTTTKNLLNTNENFITIISSLISGYEMSNKKDEIFMTIAKQFAKVALKSYDTPINGLPLPALPIKSQVNNRFALRKSSIFDITGNILELIKLSSITRENIYISSGLNVFKVMKDSCKNIFNLDFLFPTIVDSSGCQIQKKQQTTKESEKTSKSYMKSIFNGHYISCLQKQTLLSINDKLNFDTEEEETLEYIDLINEDGNVNYLFSMLKSYHLLNGNDKESGFKNYFEKAVEIMNKFMFYKPLIPKSMWHEGMSEDFILFTPVTIKKGKEDEYLNTVDILVTQTLQYKAQHCQLGGMFLYASKLFNNKKYADLGSQLINGCLMIPKLVDMDISPESVTFEKCYNLDDCFTFDADAKLSAFEDGTIFDNKFQLLSDEDVILPLEDEQETIIAGAKQAEQDSIGKHNDAIQKLMDNTPKQNPKEIIKRRDSNNNLIDLGLEYEDEDDNDSLTLTDEVDSSEILNLVKEPKKNYKVTTSKVPLTGKSFSPQTKTWFDEKYPFHINAMNSEYMMRPELIESLFYAYRITGDQKYRQEASELLTNIIKTVRQVHNKHIEISCIKDLYTMEASDELPYYWFSRTLKYFYLIFSDSSTYPLDDYIFNGDGHIFKRNYQIQS